MNEKIIPILDELVNRLSSISTVKKIYLFGSYAYGFPTDKSDLDICLVVEDGTFDNQNYYMYLGEAGILIDKLLYDNNLEYDLVACTESDLITPPNALIKDVATKGNLLYNKEIISVSHQVPTFHKSLKRN